MFVIVTAVSVVGDVTVEQYLSDDHDEELPNSIENNFDAACNIEVSCSFEIACL